MKIENKKAILFDLDGTLIDSVPDLATSVNFMLNKIERKMYSEDTIRFWVGNGAVALVKRALLGQSDITQFDDLKLFDTAIKIFLEHYSHNLANDTKLYPNVKKSLEQLKSRGYRLSIITNKPYEFIEPILKTLDIYELFEEYIGGDSLDTKKPDPQPLLYMCRKMKLDIEQSIMIGDSKNDIVSASSAGMQSIALSYGYNYGEDISVYNPTIVLDSFEDILKVLHG